MGRALVLATTLLFGLGTAARAADPSGFYTIQGVGIETCEAWLGERYEDGPITWYKQQWVLGYLTAYNRWVHDGSNVSKELTSEKLFDWLDDYCQVNSRQTLSLATEALVWTLRDRQ